MSWYADLGTTTMIAGGPHVRAIGWLSAEHAFPTGSTTPEFLARLKQYCERWDDAIDSLHWGLFMGVHECELCDSSMAAGNIGVPAGKLLYVAPEMVAHYVEAHRYAPPAEFIEAVMAAPLPGHRSITSRSRCSASSRSAVRGRRITRQRNGPEPRV